MPLKGHYSKQTGYQTIKQQCRYLSFKLLALFLKKGGTTCREVKTSNECLMSHDGLSTLDINY